jgi:hypothetical protein
MPYQYGHLLRSQANEVFQMVRDAGLDPTEFAWEVKDSSPQLTHKPSGFYFRLNLDKNDGKYRGQYSPGRSRPDALSPSASSLSGLMPYVTDWIENLAREFAVPDFWEAAAEQKALARAAEASENEPFTAAERELIGKQVRELSAYVRATGAYTDGEIRSLNSKLDYLVDSANRMGKKDWINSSIGVLFTIAWGMAMAPDVTKEMFRMAGVLFHALLNQPPLLLP